MGEILYLYEFIRFMSISGVAIPCCLVGGQCMHIEGMILTRDVALDINVGAGGDVPETWRT